MAYFGAIPHCVQVWLLVLSRRNWAVPTFSYFRCPSTCAETKHWPADPRATLAPLLAISDVQPLTPKRLGGTRLIRTRIGRARRLYAARQHWKPEPCLSWALSLWSFSLPGNVRHCREQLDCRRTGAVCNSCTLRGKWRQGE